MLKLVRCTSAALAAFAVLTAPAHASFLQEIGSPFGVGTSPVGLYSADFNRDGLPDLVSLNSGSAGATVMLRRAGGGFNTEGIVALPANPQLGTIADFNRDGLPDFGAASYEGAATSIQIRDAGVFLPAPGTPLASGKVASIAAADFNGDGFTDVAVGQYDAGTVQVLSQRRDGAFMPLGAPVPTGLGPRHIAVGDFNADARPDLAVTNVVAGTLSILICQPDGTLVQEAGSPIRVGDNPWVVVPGDFTGDGRTDLAVANYVSDSVSLLERNPDIGFTPMAISPIAVAGGPVGLATGDFNRDARLDLAVGNHRTSQVTVLLRQPDGTFAPDAGSPLSVGTNPYDLVAEDFNRDGKTDLATANATSSNVTVLLNTTPDPPGPPPPPPPPPPVPPTPSISARLVLGWSVSKSSVRLTSASLRDAPVGSRVRIYCKPCKVSQSLTTKTKTVTLSKLRNKKLKRRATFTVTITAPGYNGITLTRKVKNYGRSRSALRKAVKAPFIEGRRCVPLSGPKC